MFNIFNWFTKEKNQVKELKKELNRYKQVFTNLPVNVMLADKETKITTMNPASKNTLKAIENILPISVDKIVGASYDIFHKNPAKQRELLANPANLPHKAEIQVGEETLDLLLTALYDEDGQFMGPMVTWSVISDKLALEERNKESKDRLQSTVLSLVKSTSEASEDLSKYITTVGSATEEMVSSIQEIASNTSKAASMTQKTVEEASSVEKIMIDLEKFSKEIGEIVKVVNDISNQTNLLALNATIEAARAGEAGKGFAVVAHEVKGLAKQTSDATEDIQKKITAIQEQTGAALSSIETTTESVKLINEVVTSIAGAVEEQTAVTNEIGHNMGLASSKVETVSVSIDQINESVETNISMMN